MPAPRFEPLARGPFAETHRAFAALDDLALGLDLDPAPPDCDPAARELGRRAYQARALDEQRSLVAFTELLGELCEIGAPIDCVGSLARVVRDEAIHVDLCDRMVKRLGGWDERPPEPAWVRSPKKWPVRRRVLGTILGSLCVGETLSVAIFRGCRDGASDATAHAMLTRMLADESFHARFGFWWLESMPLREEELPFATGCVRSVFRSIVRDFLPKQAGLSTQAGEAAPYVASPFGSMSPEDRRAAVLAALDRIVVPGFEKAGIPASQLWAEALSAQSTEVPR